MVVNTFTLPNPASRLLGAGADAEAPPLLLPEEPAADAFADAFAPAFGPILDAQVREGIVHGLSQTHIPLPLPAASEDGAYG